MKDAKLKAIAKEIVHEAWMAWKADPLYYRTTIRKATLTALKKHFARPALQTPGKVSE